MRHLGFLMLAAGMAATAGGQTPRPFPTPPRSPAPAPERPAPPVAASPATPPAPQPAQSGTEAPTEATLGLPIYPNAEFIAAYDAGRGQRFYLFGVQAGYAEIVSYYQTILKNRGEEIFEAPGTHTFEVGRFREDAMAFPPGVTVKDYTWNGPEGYVTRKPGATPARFPTVIQLVPAPGGASR